MRKKVVLFGLFLQIFGTLCRFPPNLYFYIVIPEVYPKVPLPGTFCCPVVNNERRLAFKTNEKYTNLQYMHRKREHK